MRTTAYSEYQAIPSLAATYRYCLEDRFPALDSHNGGALHRKLTLLVMPDTRKN